jgi:uncharacterized protein (DUF433 family)
MKYIVLDPDVLGGRPSIAGHRIGVIHIATWAQQGMTPQGIADDYGLSLAEVHAALAYYYDHRDELDRQAAEDDARLAAYAANDQSPLAQEIRRELAARLGGDPTDRAATTPGE